MRMHAQTAMIENGFVYLPEAAPWLAPRDWYQQGAGGPTSNRGIFEYYRQRAEELRRGEAAR
jgi:hypothetical protein